MLSVSPPRAPSPCLCSLPSSTVSMQTGVRWQREDKEAGKEHVFVTSLCLPPSRASG